MFIVFNQISGSKLFHVVPFILNKIYFGNSGSFTLILTGNFQWLNPDVIKIFKIVFSKGVLLFKDSYDAAMGLMNADMLDHKEEMSLEMNSDLKDW